jgi:hypothetical protein
MPTPNRRHTALSHTAQALSLCLVLLILVGCAAPEITPTAAAPTYTPKPTFTTVPTQAPSATLPPPTATLAPTATPVPATPTVTPTPTQDPNLSPLTGLPVEDPATIKRRVLAVRIGNDPNIRPQEGLGLADLVYEEIMEGYTITRFTALFLESEAERLRPIRSARLSGLYIVPQYDAAYVHSGASDGVRWRLSQVKWLNLDEFFHSQPYRILEGYDWRGRMYTSTELLRTYLKQKGLERDERIKGYTFSSTAPSGTAATSIHVPYPSSSVVDWSYDPAQGRYLRQVQGQPHMERLTNEQIAASNVIMLYAEHKKTDIVEDTLGSTAIDIVILGSGRAQVCRDGVVIEGRWSQPSEGALVEFYDAAGQIIPLKPGKTWIQLVPPDAKVTIGGSHG